MARTYPIPASVDIKPEWRTYLQRIGSTLAGTAAVPKLDSGTSYTADQLRDKIIALQNALGAGD